MTEWRPVDWKDEEDQGDFINGLVMGIVMSIPLWVMLLALFGVRL